MKKKMNLDQIKVSSFATSNKVEEVKVAGGSCDCSLDTFGRYCELACMTVYC